MISFNLQFTRRFRTWLGAAGLAGAVAAFGQDITATGSFEPPQLAVGEQGQYTLNVSGNTMFSLSAPQIPGLGSAYSSQHQINLDNNGFTSSLIFSYAVRAKSAGTVTVPAFDIEVNGKKVTVPAATLVITESPAGSTGGSGSMSSGANGSGASGSINNSAASGNLCTLALTTPRTDVYVGEKIPIDVTVTWRADLQPSLAGDLTQQGDGFEQIHLTGNGNQSNFSNNGVEYGNCVWKTAIAPLKAGAQTLALSLPMEITLPGQNFPINDPLFQRFFGANGLPGFGQQESVKLQSVPLAMNVQDLPLEGKPANFTGGIGLFSVDQPSLSSTNLQVGVPVTLTVTVRGQGNFDRLEAPAIALGSLWRTYPPKDSFDSQDPTNLHGVKTFEYILMPMSESITEIPALDFNFFNPETKSYVEMPLQPIPVTVLPAAPGQAPAPLPAVAVASTAGPAQPELVGLHLDAGAWQSPEFRPLYASAFFLAAQAAPAIALGAFVFVRRRKLRLENDPAYARRVRAKDRAMDAVTRARAAATAGRATEFYAIAQRALQEAASHDRVDEAAALTWQEFDNHLAATGVSAELRQKTREIFTAGDALRFGGVAPDQAELTDTAARLDELVQQLLGKS